MDKQIKDFDKYIKQRKKDLAIIEGDIASKKKTKAALQTELNDLTDKKLHIKSYLDKKEEELSKSVREKEIQLDGKLKEAEDTLTNAKKMHSLANKNLKDAETEKNRASSANASVDSAKQVAERVVKLVKKCKEIVDDTLAEI